MITKLFNSRELNTIQDCLEKGGLVAIPTDTIYGLAVMANNFESIHRLREVKQRPDEKVFAYMVDSIKKIEEVCELSDRDRYLINRWLPGPITFVFNKKKNNIIVSQSEMTTLAIRIPNHPFILGLVSQMEIGLYVPSANISGYPPCLNSEEILKQFDGLIEGIVLDEAYGERPSTIIDCSGEDLVCIREGVITLEEIKEGLNGYI